MQRPKTLTAWRNAQFNTAAGRVIQQAIGLKSRLKVGDEVLREPEQPEALHAESEAWLNTGAKDAGGVTR